MSATARRELKTSPPGPAAILILAGLATLLLPLALDMYRQFWSTGKNGQAPVVIAAAAYAYWINREVLTGGASRGERIVGTIAIVIGWLLFVLGRAGAFYQLEGAALPAVSAGLCLSIGGRAALRRLALVNILLLASIPLPGSLADAVLVPLKEFISKGVVALLASLGYPVAVNGVVISIGFTQLQIADACSGLWSMVSLVAIGLLYEFFVPSSKRRVMVLFLLSIIPIALFTNFARVLTLVLIAFNGGSGAEAATHDIAAYLEVVMSLALFASVHAILERLFGRQPSTAPG